MSLQKTQSVNQTLSIFQFILTIERKNVRIENRILVAVCNLNIENGNVKSGPQF